MGNVDWNEEIKPGPLEIGFDYAFLIPATGDRVPTVYMENRDIVNLDPADPITVSYKGKSRRSAYRRRKAGSASPTG